MARLVFKLTKTFARPIAFRLRSYMVGGLQAETQRLHLTVAQSLEAHRQAQLVATDRLLTIHTTHVLQEIQALRESLHRSQPHAHPKSGNSLAAHPVAVQEAAVRVQPDAFLLRTAVGPVLCPASDFALASVLMETGEFQRGTRLVIERLLSPGGTFIDAGANIGMHTLAAARAIGQKGRIVAFEPVAASHDLLKKSAWMNGYCSTVETHQAAASNQAASEALPSSLFGDVPLVRIDDIEKQDGKVDVIKFDAASIELQALEGAAETIARNARIVLIVEFDVSRLRKVGQTTSEWLGRFERMGLIRSVIDPETGALREISASELEGNSPVNLLFARAGSTALVQAKETP